MSKARHPAVELSEIEIIPINSVEGVELYNELTNYIFNNSDTKYFLKIDINFDSSNRVIQKNSTTLRAKIRLKTNYQLREKNTNKLLTSGSFTKFTSYSTTNSPYSSSVKKNATMINLSKLAAQDLKNRLISFFHHQNNNQANE